MSENFKDHPVSITELRSDRTGNCKDWTPRDVLIHMLREMDAGNLDAEQLVVGYGKPLPDGSFVGGFFSSCPSVPAALGLLDYAKFRVYDCRATVS